MVGRGLLKEICLVSGRVLMRHGGRLSGALTSQVGVHVVVKVADVARHAHPCHNLAIPGKAGVHVQHACAP